jgi:hypothetical protein
LNTPIGVIATLVIVPSDEPKPVGKMDRGAPASPGIRGIVSGIVAKTPDPLGKLVEERLLRLTVIMSPFPGMLTMLRPLLRMTGVNVLVGMTDPIGDRTGIVAPVATPPLTVPRSRFLIVTGSTPPMTGSNRVSLVDVAAVVVAAVVTIAAVVVAAVLTIAAIVVAAVLNIAAIVVAAALAAALALLCLAACAMTAFDECVCGDT